MTPLTAKKLGGGLSRTPVPMPMPSRFTSAKVLLCPSYSPSKANKSLRMLINLRYGDMARTFRRAHV